MNITWDPLDPILLLFEPIFLGIAVALLFASGKVKSDWVRASLAMLGLSILGIRVLAIWPSWWLYFADGKLGWGGQGCVEIDLQCFKQAAKDTVVVIENAVVLGAFVVGFILWQKKHPKQFASGESKPEGGGYK